MSGTVTHAFPLLNAREAAAVCIVCNNHRSGGYRNFLCSLPTPQLEILISSSQYPQYLQALIKQDDHSSDNSSALLCLTGWLVFYVNHLKQFVKLNILKVIYFLVTERRQRQQYKSMATHVQY